MHAITAINWLDLVSETFIGYVAPVAQNGQVILAVVADTSEILFHLLLFLILWGSSVVTF